MKSQSTKNSEIVEYQSEENTGSKTGLSLEQFYKIRSQYIESDKSLTSLLLYKDGILKINAFFAQINNNFSISNCIHLISPDVEKNNEKKARKAKLMQTEDLHTNTASGQYFGCLSLCPVAK